MDQNENGGSEPSAQLNPVQMDGEVRILDTDLATRLGFERPRKVRELIARHRAALEAMGVLVVQEGRPTVGRTPENNGLGGAPAKAYYLNRKQAIFVTAKSETATATEITIEIIERFDAYERGEVVDPMKVLNDPAAMRSLLLGYTEKVLELQAANAQLAPKAEALDRIASADGSHCITDAAKLLQVGPRVLFDYLSRRGWIYRRAGADHWCAYQSRIISGDLVHKVTTVLRPDGSEKTTEQVRVTAQGVTKLAKLIGSAARLVPPGEEAA